MGGGSLGSLGYNSIYSNNASGTGQIGNSGADVTAKYNWWGTATPVDSTVYDTAVNAVVYTNYLSYDPNL
jgi:hypothetical protein